VTRRRERIRRNLLDDLKERRWYSHLKEKAIDRIVWRARFGRGFGPVVRQTAKKINVTTDLQTFEVSNLPCSCEHSIFIFAMSLIMIRYYSKHVAAYIWKTNVLLDRIYNTSG
jgi:hypothetical protein